MPWPVSAKANKIFRNARFGETGSSWKDPIRGLQRGRRCEFRLLTGLQESTGDGGVMNPPAAQKRQWNLLQQKAQKAAAQGGDSLL